ncbi:lipoprotein-releasing system permease protein [Marinomonas polaris DSM 16579]|uniref:Lipoprotein-releasing system permease protein n=1 Tax=Marinomonas polaris DSM 16579 TaxID=1122206 RepID=A0A1M5MIM7_9GAMM|nr:ABC transporter permease [Marinomonas polaris]SHG77125.1 lipoprotein-releasing system permease protein [Marinomonas polaris DSM 16579]
MSEKALEASELKTLPSWQPFEWIVALRFLGEGRTQTAFIISGVALGVAVIVFMSALMAGLQSNITKSVLSGQAHIQLQPAKETVRPLRSSNSTLAVGAVVEGAIIQTPLQRIDSIDQWQSIMVQISEIPDVLVVSPAAKGSALVVRGNTSQAISINGVKPDLYFQIIDMTDKMVSGTMDLTGSDILIGIELASDLGVSLGDKIRVTMATGADNTLTITGIFDFGNKTANSQTTYVALRTAQSLLGMVGSVSVLDVNVKDIYAAETIAQRIEASTGVQADSWIKNNAQLFTSLGAQQSSNTVIRLFVALSVALGIASVLVVSVVQKSREIGILRAMGITRGQILRTFLLQGGLLGLCGSIIGTARWAVGFVRFYYWFCDGRGWIIDLDANANR